MVNKVPLTETVQIAAEAITSTREQLEPDIPKKGIIWEYLGSKMTRRKLDRWQRDEENLWRNEGDTCKTRHTFKAHPNPDHVLPITSVHQHSFEHSASNS